MVSVVAVPSVVVSFPSNRSKSIVSGPAWRLPRSSDTARPSPGRTRRSIHVRSFGVGDVFIGLLAAAYSLVQFLFAPLLGRISDERVADLS
ncbi:MAG: MFS family permease [Halobacteriales archaeon]|jgi:MFS family permease